jgi:hypothetical protein
MIPSAFVALQSFPLTPNGKVDRRALPAPDGGTTDEEAFIAPSTLDEAVLADIWSDILGVSPISVAANFFELGGHSLLATQMMSRIREKAQVDVPLRAFFEAPTIAQLAVVIADIRAQGDSGKPALAPITRSARRQQ